MLDELDEDGFDYIVCDSPAGIEKGAYLAMYFADEAIVVANPEVSVGARLRPHPRPAGVARPAAPRTAKRVKEHLLLTRYSPERVESGEMLSVDDVEEVLGLKTLGVIPESGDVLNASNKGEPVILDTGIHAGQAYDDAVARLLGEDTPDALHPSGEEGLLQQAVRRLRHGTVRFPQAEEEHRLDRQGPPAHHRRAGAQPRAAARTTCRCCSASCWK